MDNDIPYLLLTPGPLTTSRRVREAMMRDYSTWDVDYNSLVDRVRDQLVRLATNEDGYTCVLMQGSGTFAVEATLGSVLPAEGRLLVINNGAYGQRMATIAEKLGIPHLQLQAGETHPPATADLQQVLAASPEITHVAMVHCETTTGMLNPAAEIGQVAKDHGCCYIVDAMSSLGGVPLSMEELKADYLVSSANKCIQGVPGFGFVIARQQSIEAIHGQARSLSLDLFDQWQEMESKGGKWRYTSPTHVVCAFAEALAELEDEGGVEARVCSASQRLSQLQVGASQGALLASGIRVVLAGQPNVGKSSLLNRLSTEDRVIVSDIAGTTRDVVTVSTEIEGLKVELVDTAGLREAENALEAEGVKRAHRAIEEADLALLVVDDVFEAEGANGGLENEWPAPVDYILVRNKCDLSGRRIGVLDERSPPTVCVSAKTGAGLDALKRCIASAAGYQVGTEPPVMARQRHIQAINRAREHLVQAETHAVQGQGELIAEALRLAQDCLGEITGAVTTEELLGNIFSSFCIGK